MDINRKDIAVAVLKDGTMLVAQGTGLGSGIYKMLKDHEPNVADMETGLYYSQLRYRSIRKVNGQWKIVKGREGNGTTFKPTERLHGGIYLRL